MGELIFLEGSELWEVNRIRDKITINHESHLNKDTIAFSSLKPCFSGEIYGFDVEYLVRGCYCKIGQMCLCCTVCKSRSSPLACFQLNIVVCSGLKLLYWFCKCLFRQPTREQMKKRKQHYKVGKMTGNKCQRQNESSIARFFILFCFSRWLWGFLGPYRSFIRNCTWCVVKNAEFSSSRSLLDSMELAYVMRQEGEDFIMGTQHGLSRLQRVSQFKQAVPAACCCVLESCHDYQQNQVGLGSGLWEYSGLALRVQLRAGTEAVVRVFVCMSLCVSCKITSITCLI